LEKKRVKQNSSAKQGKGLPLFIGKSAVLICNEKATLYQGDCL